MKTETYFFHTTVTAERNKQKQANKQKQISKTENKI